MGNIDEKGTGAQISDFAAAVYDPGDWVEIRRLPGQASTWVLASELAALAKVLETENAAGQNIYAGANPRPRHGAKGDESIALARCLFADFDKTTAEDALARIDAAKLPPPTLTLSSGHGYHAYWRLAEPVTDLEVWRDRQKDLIALLGTDDVIHNPERIMRLPGFVNHKPPAAPCELIDSDPTRVYEWADLLSLIPKRPDAPKLASPIGDSIPDGSRDSTLTSLAGTMRRRGMSEDAIAAALQVENQRRCDPPLSQSQVAKVAASVARYEPTERPAIPAAVRPQFKTVRELVAAHPEERPPIIEGLLREGETMNVIAAPKVGKSWTVTDLAISIVAGRPWLGTFKTKPGDVLIIDNELHPETSADRIPKVANARGVPASQYEDRLCVENLRGRLVDLFGMAGYFDSIPPRRFKVIVIDAWYRMLPMGESENDNGLSATMYNFLDKNAKRLQCAFVVIHHTSKGSQAGKSVTDVGAGAGAQSRAADAHLVLRATDTPGLVALDAAVRSWRPPDTVYLEWSFPVWNRLADAPKKAEPIQWTPELFADHFVSRIPQTKADILRLAKTPGLSGPGLGRDPATALLTEAVRLGLVKELRYGANKSRQYILTSSVN